MPSPVEPEAGKASYACRMDVMAKTKTDSRKEEYGASLSVLFCASRQMTAIVQSVAVEKGAALENGARGDCHARRWTPGDINKAVFY